MSVIPETAMGDSDGSRTSKTCPVKSPESAHVNLSKRKVLVKCTEFECTINITAKYDAKR